MAPLAPAPLLASPSRWRYPRRPASASCCARAEQVAAGLVAYAGRRALPPMPRPRARVAARRAGRASGVRSGVGRRSGRDRWPCAWGVWRQTSRIWTLLATPSVARLLRGGLAANVPHMDVFRHTPESAPVAWGVWRQTSRIRTSAATPLSCPAQAGVCRVETRMDPQHDTPAAGALVDVAPPHAESDRHRAPTANAGPIAHRCRLRTPRPSPPRGASRSRRRRRRRPRWGDPVGSRHTGAIAACRMVDQWAQTVS